MATLSGVAPTTDGDVVTISSAAAVLTEDGAKVFSGFYKSGDALDPVTVAVSLEDGAGLPTPPATSGGTSGGDTTGGSASGGSGSGSGGTGPDDVSTVGGSGDSSGGTLAATGSDTPNFALLAAAGALVVTGAGATFTVARRRSA